MKVQGRDCTLTLLKDNEYYPLPYSEETVRQASKGYALPGSIGIRNSVRARRFQPHKWLISPGANNFPFMQNFLSTLYVCYQELDKRFAVVNSNKITKTSRIESTVLNSLLPISKAEICKLLPDISPTTVEAVLGKMVKSGIITTIGNGRATKYLRK